MTTTINFNDLQPIILDAGRIVKDGNIRSTETFADAYSRLREDGHDAVYASSVMMVALGIHRQVNAVLLRASAPHGAALRMEKAMFGDMLQKGDVVMLGKDIEPEAEQPEAVAVHGTKDISDVSDVIAEKLRDTAEWRMRLADERIKVRANTRAAKALEALAAQADDVGNFNRGSLALYHIVWESEDAHLLAEVEHQALLDIGYNAFFESPQEYLDHMLREVCPSYKAA